MAQTAPPRLTFACELTPEKLTGLFDDAGTLASLKRLEARVSLALVDLSDERAAVVRRINDAGVLTVANLLLPLDRGYFFNLDDAPAAAARYDEFRAWTHDYGLSWDAVALDLEPSAEEMRRLFTPGQRLGLLRTVVPRALGRERLRRGTEAYSGLIARMHADGFRVESYQFPFLIEDRMARSSILHRLLSVPDVRTDRDAWMIYTSFQERFGPALLASYGPDAEAIAVGSTGGAAEDLEGVVTPTLDWDGLARDLRLAQRFTDEISIHSLEGCISQGMLGRLEGFEWGVEERVPLLQVRIVDSVRRLLRWILWAAAHPYASAAMLTVGVALFTKRRRGGD